jgi:thymidine kinase
MENAAGEIQIIFGPMFSGKSTEMFRRLRRFVVSDYKCMVVKYAKDTRYASRYDLISPMDDLITITNGTSVVTHDGVSVNAYGTETLETFQNEIGEEVLRTIDVIGIDEGQFFPDVVEYVEKWANLGKVIVVAALDGTFQRKSFNDILNLIPLAESITKLTSICQYCKKEASFSLRVGTEQQIELIGGKGEYYAVCRRCYFNYKPKITNVVQ